jgi:hypothetical protein
LKSVQDNGWQNLMTLDESWFYLWMSQEIVWIQADQPSPAKLKHMIGERKTIVTIVWNPQSLHLIDALLKGQKSNASYYINMIL